MSYEITSEDRQFARINTASSGYTTLIPAVAGKKVLVWGYHLSVAGDVVINMVDLIGASDRTTLDGPHTCTDANGIRGLAFADSRFGIFEGREGAAIQIQLDAAVQTSGVIRYRYV